MNPELMFPLNHYVKMSFSFSSLTLHVKVLPFGSIAKQGLKLTEYLILDIVNISFVNVAWETRLHHSFTLWHQQTVN